MTPAHFREHLDVLRRFHRPVPLTRVLACVRNGESSRGRVAVTFDDGYADVAREAAPALAEYDVPATFFVTTDMIGSTREFWWDELERLVLHTVALPDPLALRFGLAVVEWRLGNEARRAPDPASHRGWRAWTGGAPTARHALYRELWKRCQRLSASQREDVLDQLRAAVGSDPGIRDSQRTMTGQEVRTLAACALFEIGAHSKTHPMLATMSSSAQRDEIAGSKRCLESLLDRPIATFAYPFGGERDYTRETVDLVRQAGYRGACANVPGTIVPERDPYQLPRLFVHDWDGDELARQLSGAHG